MNNNNNKKNNNNNLSSNNLIQNQKPNQNTNNTINNSVSSFNRNNDDMVSKLNEIEQKRQMNVANQINNQARQQQANEEEEEIAEQEEQGEQEQLEKKEKKEKKQKGSQSVASKAMSKLAGGNIMAKVAVKKASTEMGAEGVANMVTKMLAKQFRTKLIIAGAVVLACFIILILIICGIDMNDDDNSRTASDTNGFFTNRISDDELYNYLAYISICPEVPIMEREMKKADFEGTPYEFAKSGEIDMVETCHKAIEYYEALKEIYTETKKHCYKDANEGKEELPDFYRHKNNTEAEFGNNPKVKAYYKKGKLCQETLPTQLITETMSYYFTDQELFRDKYNETYDPYGEDFARLAEAMSQFSHEYCYMWEYTINGEDDGTSCDPHNVKPGVVCKLGRVSYDGYYYELNFNKYVCYLKYGDKCSHPNYQFENPNFDTRTNESTYTKGNPHNYFETECSGQNSDSLGTDSPNTEIVSSAPGDNSSTKREYNCYECTKGNMYIAIWQKTDPTGFDSCHKVWANDRSECELTIKERDYKCYICKKGNSSTHVWQIGYPTGFDSCTETEAHNRDACFHG